AMSSDARAYTAFRVMSSNPEDNPGSLRLHGCWMQLSMHCAGLHASMNHLKSVPAQPKTWSLNPSDYSESRDSSKSRLRPFHPEGRFRICWDLVSLVLLLCDALLLPISIAWDWRLGLDNAASTLLFCSIWSSLVFWTLDVLVNLNTAVYIKGLLVHRREAILSRYMRSWLLLDISLVSLDYLNVAQDFDTDLAFLRFGRIIRAFRLLRLLKMTKLDEIIQEMAASTGRQWIMLVIAIFNSAVAAMLVAHMVTCFWFWVGSATQADGRTSWIHLAGATGLDAGTQYVHSLRYVMNSPAPPTIAPDSAVERIVDIMNNIFTLVVIGSAVSKISGTLAELRAMNEARSRQRREIRVYLSSQDASFELVSRIMKFVEYKMDKISPVTFDPTLISLTLQTELYAGQRGQFLESVPIFRLTKVAFPDAFATICTKMQKHVFETKENIFNAGAVATSMYITATGKFLHRQADSQPQVERQVLGQEWFEELALYAESLVHHCTLTATTFAEVLSLDGQDLCTCLQYSPSCASMFCEYAKAFTESMKKFSSKPRHEQQLDKAEICCKRTKMYQELFPDPKTRLQNINLGNLVEETKSRETYEMNIESIESSPQSNSSSSSHASLAEYLAGLSGEQLQLDQLQTELWTHLVELHPQHGPYILFEKVLERDRAESSCINLLAMIFDRYDILVKPQADDSTRLQHGQWAQLQKVIKWIQPDTDQIHAALVLLAIRGLGKSPIVVNQIDCQGRPEKAVFYLVQNAQNVVPAVTALSEKGLYYLRSVLSIHEAFNFAQMLQGENVPANVAQLQEHVQEHGQQVFHCYILFLLGFMSGLSGGRGSKFLIARNAQVLIASMQVLTRLTELTPRSVYWGYMRARADSLLAPFATAEDLALVRLACLSRVQDNDGYIDLRSAWTTLGRKEKAALINHLLADGIQQQAMIFEFLPDCVQKALGNSSVGLARLLEVLVDLLINLGPALHGKVHGQMILIDLSDLSEFIAAVQNSFVFQTCISRSKLEVSGGKPARVQLEMTSDNWSRSNEADSDLMSLSYRLRDILQKQQWMESVLMHGDTVSL
ncbi:unnamed protein product, partial [Effrenium voratum]